MNKSIFGIAVLAVVLSACGGSKKTDMIVGSWIMPVDGQPEAMQGISLKADGKASSINMETLIYQSWKQQGDDLYLKVKSIGNGMEIEGVDTLKIEKLTADSLILESNYGYTLRFARQK